jgi:hypothetical protein
VGVALSALTFVLVSKVTKPTPRENLRIFFDEPANAERQLTTRRVQV